MKMAKKKKTKKSKNMVKAKKSPEKKLIVPPYRKQKTSESKFLIAILIVLIILFFASSFYNKYKIRSDANAIINRIVVGDEVDEQALNRLMSKDYNELKKELGITKDFIVYFEDENNNPIEINGMYCFGYEEAALNGCR